MNDKATEENQTLNDANRTTQRQVAAANVAPWAATCKPRQNNIAKRKQRHKNKMPWYNVVPYLKAIHHGSKSNAQRRKSHDAKASCSSKRGAMGGNLQTTSEQHRKAQAAAQKQDAMVQCGTLSESHTSWQ
jgi:hypothetical protein